MENTNSSYRDLVKAATWGAVCGALIAAAVVLFLALATPASADVDVEAQQGKVLMYCLREDPDHLEGCINRIARDMTSLTAEAKGCTAEIRRSGKSPQGRCAKLLACHKLHQSDIFELTRCAGYF